MGELGFARDANPTRKDLNVKPDLNVSPDLRVYNVEPRPYGLPKFVKYEQYHATQVCYLSAWNYKVEASIGPTIDTQTPRLTVLDTGAGPNLIRADLLPASTLSTLDKKRQIVNLASASNHRLDTLGIVTLSVTIGTYRVRTPFVVTRKLGADALLGCTYIDQHVETIKPRGKYIQLANGDITDIRRRPDCTPTNQTAKEPLGIRPPPSDARRIRVARQLVLPPRSETNVAVTCGVNGTQLLESKPCLYDKKLLKLSNGIVSPKRQQPFIVRVANFGETPQRLSKNEILGLAIEAPTTILSIDWSQVDAPKQLEDQQNDTTTASRTPSNDASLPTTHTKGLGEILSKTSVPSGSTGQTTRDAPLSLEDVDLDHLQPRWRNKVKAMLGKYAHMWQGQLGQIAITEHKIDLQPESNPVFSQPYRAGPKARKIEQEEVEQMLKQGVIEPAASEWASPVVLVPKPDGSLRFCVDYRKLNAITVKDTYPLPRIDECLDSLGEAKYFSTLDCNSGYWQVPVRKSDRDKTTFTCHCGSYRFCRMPFGLCNAPATFQRTLDILLAGYRWKSCLVYLDDIIVFSKTLGEHVTHVEEILQVLQAAGASLRLKKCKFFTQSVDYLGHVIRPGLLEVASKNTAAIEGIKEPTTQTQLRSFLGLCNVYRRFVPNFARTAGPLNLLLTKGYSANLAPFTAEQSQAFKLLKQSLKAPPVLRLPREDLPWSVDTDACDYQVGCALMQTYEDGTRHPIGFWSRSLAPAEKNYTVSEKECLAVIWAVQILRPYLERTHFDLYTDHQALRWMFNMADASSRLARWRLRLLEYDFTVQYRKGSANTVADAISRLPTFGETTTAPDLDIPCLLVVETDARSPISTLKEGEGVPGLTAPACPETACCEKLTDDLDSEDGYVESYVDRVCAAEEAVEITPISLETMVKEQSTDDFCVTQAKAINANEFSRYLFNEKGLLVRKSPLDGTVQIVVPKCLRPKVLHMGHYPRMMGHPGGTRMYYTLRRHYYWPSLPADVYATVRNCLKCARERIKLKKHSRFMKLFPATRPLEFVSIDILGPLKRTTSGNEFLLVMTCRFSKLTRTVPLRTITAYTVAKAFCESWVFPYGPPVYLLSDNGGQFTAKYFQSICEILGIRNLFTSAYHPQTNGQVERFNRTILAALRRYVSEDLRNWDEFTDAIVYGYNTQVHRATGLSPFDLTLSRTPVPLSLERTVTIDKEALEPRQLRTKFRERLRSLIGTAAQKLQAAQARYKADFDKRVRPGKFDIAVGDFVFLRREAPVRGEQNKLLSPVTGPFKVIKLSTHTVVIINQEGDEDTVSLDRVIKAPGHTEEEGRIQDIGTPPREQAGSTNNQAYQAVNDESRTCPVDHSAARATIQTNTNQDVIQGKGLSPETRTRTSIQTTGPTAHSPKATAEQAPYGAPISAHDTNEPRRITRSQSQPPDINQNALIGPKLTKESNSIGQRHVIQRNDTVKIQGNAKYRGAAGRAKDTPEPSVLTAPTAREYVVDRVVDYDEHDNVVRVRWDGFTSGDDTWQPPQDIPFHFIRRYFKRTRKPIPTRVFTNLPEHLRSHFENNE